MTGKNKIEAYSYLKEQFYAYKKLIFVLNNRIMSTYCNIMELLTLCNYINKMDDINVMEQHNYINKRSLH